MQYLHSALEKLKLVVDMRMAKQDSRESQRYSPDLVLNPSGDREGPTFIY